MSGIVETGQGQGTQVHRLVEQEPESRLGEARGPEVGGQPGMGAFAVAGNGEGSAPGPQLAEGGKGAGQVGQMAAEVAPEEQPVRLLGGDGFPQQRQPFRVLAPEVEVGEKDDPPRLGRGWPGVADGPQTAVPRLAGGSQRQALPVRSGGATAEDGTQRIRLSDPPPTAPPPCRATRLRGSGPASGRCRRAPAPVQAPWPRP